MTNLPSPAPLANARSFVPKATQICSTIDKYVRALEGLDHVLHGYEDDGVRFTGTHWNEKDIAEAKQMLAQHEAMRSRWVVMRQSATKEQIGTATTYLVTSFFNVAKSERENVTRVLCEDIAAEEPSLYMLASMVRTVRHSCEFLSVATVVKKLRQARRAARQCEQVLISAQLGHDIEHAEQRLPEIAKEEATYRAQRLKRLRELIKDTPPEIFTGCYTHEDRVLLGLEDDK